MQPIDFDKPVYFRHYSLLETSGLDLSKTSILNAVGLKQLFVDIAFFRMHQMYFENRENTLDDFIKSIDFKNEIYKTSKMYLYLLVDVYWDKNSFEYQAKKKYTIGQYYLSEGIITDIDENLLDSVRISRVKEYDHYCLHKMTSKLFSGIPKNEIESFFGVINSSAENSINIPIIKRLNTVGIRVQDQPVLEVLLDVFDYKYFNKISDLSLMRFGNSHMKHALKLSQNISFMRDLTLKIVSNGLSQRMSKRLK